MKSHICLFNQVEQELKNGSEIVIVDYSSGVFHSCVLYSLNQKTVEDVAKQFNSEHGDINFINNAYSFMVYMSSKEALGLIASANLSED